MPSLCRAWTGNAARITIRHAARSFIAVEKNGDDKKTAAFLQLLW
jgi:hypothetical protein